MLNTIKQRVEDLAYVMKIDNGDDILFSISCTDGMTWELAFKSKEERSLLWNELALITTTPFIQVGSNSLVREEHIRVMGVEQTKQGTPAIIFHFANSPPLSFSYPNRSDLEKDYWTMLRILSDYHERRTTVRFTTTLQ